MLEAVIEADTPGRAAALGDAGGDAVAPTRTALLLLLPLPLLEATDTDGRDATETPTLTPTLAGADGTDTDELPSMPLSPPRLRAVYPAGTGTDGAAAAPGGARADAELALPPPLLPLPTATELDCRLAMPPPLLELGFLRCAEDDGACAWPTLPAGPHSPTHQSCMHTSRHVRTRGARTCHPPSHRSVSRVVRARTPRHRRARSTS